MITTLTETIGLTTTGSKQWLAFTTILYTKIRFIKVKVIGETNVGPTFHNEHLRSDWLLLDHRPIIVLAYLLSLPGKDWMRNGWTKSVTNCSLEQMTRLGARAGPAKKNNVGWTDSQKKCTARSTRPQGKKCLSLRIDVIIRLRYPVAY